MIRTAIEFIKKELESYIVSIEQNPADYYIGNVVGIEPVINPEGNYNLSDTGHISVMLVGIEEERREGKRPYYQAIDEGQKKQLRAPVEIDIYLLFVGHNLSYETTLRDVSSVVNFFQANPVFDDNKYPAMNAAASDAVNKPWQLIERLSFRMQGMTFEQQNNLWAMLGGKYLPSVLYHVNMLTVFNTRSDVAAPAISEMDYNE